MPRLFSQWMLAAWFVVTLLVVGQGAWAQQGLDADSGHQQIDLQWSFEWSRGHYGELTATDIRQTTLLARVRWPRWTAEVEVPWLAVRSGADVSSLPGSAGIGNATEHGLGDVWLKLTWEAREFTPDTTGLDLTLKLKTPTGDIDKGLGSGGTDVAVQVAATTRLSDRTLAFGHLGYRRTGDLAGYAPYKDPWYSEVGAQYTLSPSWNGGAYHTARQAIGRLGALNELTIFTAWREASQKMQFYLTRGFARASPQWALGMSLRQRF